MTLREAIACSCPRARHQHGTKLMRETHGCNCYPCRLAVARARRLNRSGISCPEATHVLRVGTRRRLQALHALGWSGGELAARLDITYQAVHLMRGTRAEITPANAERVAALYDQLWNQQPVGIQVTKTRNWARRKGWVPPLAWDDDEIDDPAATPHTPRNRPVEYQPCGTSAAYRRHRRAGQKPCRACLGAEARRQAERKAAA